MDSDETTAEARVELDRSADLALYGQIASRLRYEIVTGVRDAGDPLPSLREAAELWGVNLHTVRRAYKELEAAGLVVTNRPAGTRVAPLERMSLQQDQMDSFIEDMAAAASDRYGLSREELAAKLFSPPCPGQDRTAGTVVECSRTLSNMLVDELSPHVASRLRAQDLRSDEPLPPGPVFSTWFHRADLAQRMRDRPGDLHLLRIRPATAVFESLHEQAAAGRLRTIILVDRHPASAHDLSLDFHRWMGADFPTEIRIPSDPVVGFPEQRPGTALVATPQTWDQLTPQLKARSDVMLLRYEIDEEDVKRVALSLVGARFHGGAARGIPADR